MARLLLISLSLLLLLAACTAAVPRPDLRPAGRVVARAYAAGAAELAPAQYQRASSALQRSRQLVAAGRFAEARRLLPSAEKSARAAIAASRRELARRRREREKAARTTPPPPRPEKSPPTPRKPAASPAAPPAAAPPAVPAPPPPPARPGSYTVTDGETLWTIAARPSIYHDPLLWPLLYKANRDQIKDPRQIYPGQVLTIPRHVPEAQLEKARQEARSSDVFPLSRLGLPALTPPLRVQERPCAAGPKSP